MKNKILPSIVLATICIVVALLLAVVNMVTAPMIEAAKAEKVQKMLSSVMPEGKDFVEISCEGCPEAVTAAYTEVGGGYVFQMEVKGFKKGLTIMCGIDSEGNITGADYVTSSETLSAEVGLGVKYVGQNKDTFTPEIISGATKTTEGYASAIKAALEAYEILAVKEAE